MVHPEKITPQRVYLMVVITLGKTFKLKFIYLLLVGTNIT